jgi:thiol-disulfide isomerase/thioredoxin
MTHNHKPSPIIASRRAFLAGLAVAAVATITAACGRSEAQPADQPFLSIDAFPEGLGRGFPVAERVTGNTDTGLRQGNVPPNFRLTLADGQGLTLHDLTGRPVMLNFWATWCGPCRIEMPEIVRRAQTESELTVIAVNVREELSLVQAFAADFQITMPVALDLEGEISDLYEVRGMPTSYFVGRDGQIAAVWTGLLTPDKLAEMLDKVI